MITRQLRLQPHEWYVYAYFPGKHLGQQGWLCIGGPVTEVDAEGLMRDQRSYLKRKSRVRLDTKGRPIDGEFV